MVFCRFCKNAYDETSFNEVREHNLKCSQTARLSKYKSILDEYQEKKKNIDISTFSLGRQDVKKQKRYIVKPSSCSITTPSRYFYRRAMDEHKELRDQLFVEKKTRRSTLDDNKDTTGDSISEKTSNIFEDNGDVGHCNDRNLVDTKGSNENIHGKSIDTDGDSSNDDDSHELDKDDSSSSSSRSSSNKDENTFEMSNTDETELGCQYEIEGTGIPSLIDLHKRTSYTVTYFSKQDKLSLELANILKKGNIPLFVYGDIMRWCKKLQTLKKFDAVPLDKLVKRSAVKFGLERTFPITRMIQLPSGNTIAITKFCFTSQLFSLLSDENLMKPENLVFGNDPYKRFSDPRRNKRHIYNDVETSDWFFNTQESYCKSVKDVLIPIIIFIDKTHVKGNCTEPISFTLGIFKRNIRRKPIAWRNMGLIPGKLGELESDDINLRLKNVGKSRIKDWHAACEYIMSDFAVVQKRSLLRQVESVIFGKRCNIQLPIMFLIGDIEGHDKTCTRKASHGALMNGVTHSCKVKRSICGNAGQSCTYFLKDEIASLQTQTLDQSLDKETKKEAIEKLNEFGFQHGVDNHFFKLDYGDSLGGLHTACTVCLMHTFKQRFPNDIIDILINTFGATWDTVGSHTMNRSIMRLIPYCMRQSDRTFPKETSSFQHSFVNPKFTLTANEKYARLICFLWFGYTSAGRKFLNETRHKYYSKVHITSLMKLFEASISLYQFLSQDEIKKSDVKNGRSSIVEFQKLYKSMSITRQDFLDTRTKVGEKKSSVKEEVEERSTVNRSNGRNKRKEKSSSNKKHDNVCQFPKFHYLNHVMDQIEMFGSSNNFNGDQCESNHKYISKATGIKTQGRGDTFDMQTSQRFASQLILDKTLRHVGIVENDNKDQHNKPKPPYIRRDSEGNIRKVNIADPHKCAAWVVLKRSTEDDKITYTWKGRKHYEIPQSILRFVNDTIFKSKKKNQKGFDVIFNNDIECYTSLKWNENIFRAHPCYRGEPWNDYATICWDINDGEECCMCPARLELFLRLRGHRKFVDGDYAIIYSTDIDADRSRPTEKAYKKWVSFGRSPFQRFWTFEKKYTLVHIETIASVCFVYPDFEDEDFKVPSEDYVIELLPLEEWGKIHQENGVSWSY